MVVVGGDKLREGTKVEIVTSEAAGAPAQERKTPQDGVPKDRR